MRLFSLWNFLGLIFFALGALVYWQSQGWHSPSALPLPTDPTPGPGELTMILYRPNSPQGLQKEPLTLPLGPGEAPASKVLEVWAEATKAPRPKALYQWEKLLVADLPADFAQGLDVSGETLRLYSLAYTLLATFPQAQEVRFLVEGEPRPGLTHLDLSQPFRLP